MSFNKFTMNTRTIFGTKRGSFDMVSSRFVSLRNSTFQENSKSLVCKVHSLTRVLFEIKAHNFAWKADLEKKKTEIYLPMQMSEHTAS